jgi:hypothetical protein
MDEETLTVWLDTALLMLGGFVLMSVLMMTVMNPPTRSSDSDNIQAPGKCHHRGAMGRQARCRRRSLGPGAGRRAGRLFEQKWSHLQFVAR